MLIWKIAFRNLFRQKRRTIFTGMSMVIGFVLACFFIGWADGMYNEVIDKFTQSKIGHIQIHKDDYLDSPKMYKNLNNYNDIYKILDETNEVVSFTSRIKSGGIVSLNDNSAGSQILGIDPVLEKKTTNFDKNVIKGNYFSEKEDSYECLIGRGLARILNAKIGDDIVVVSQGADGSFANEMYKLQGVLDLGNDIENRSAFYIKLNQAQELFVLYGSVHEMVIILDKIKDVKKVKGILKSKISDNSISVDTWQVVAKDFYRAMKADKKGMWISLIVVILIVAVGVLNAVLMSILERRREYGVLKAIGTKPKQIISLIIIENGILAVASIFIGIIFGTLVNYIFSIWGFTLPEPMTYGGLKFQTLHGEINFRSYWIPTIVVFFSSILICIIPAIKAAKTNAAEAMRRF